jgi:hypothetical protein
MSETIDDENKATSKGGVFLDKNCISCSGNSQVLLQNVKVACLNFQNNPVKFDGKIYTMD